jgi:hypothetical protein
MKQEPRSGHPEETVGPSREDLIYDYEPFDCKRIFGITIALARRLSMTAAIDCFIDVTDSKEFFANSLANRLRAI